MEALKTQSVAVSGTKKVEFNDHQNMAYTSKQLNTMKVGLQGEIVTQQKTLKQQIHEIREAASDTRRISKINPFISYFPTFYKKELRNSFALFIVWTCLLLTGLGLMGWSLYLIISSEYISSFVSLLLLPAFVLLVGLWIVYTNKFYMFRQEAKTINFKDEKTLSINTVKLYKRLKVGYINVNWMSATSYGICLLVILINFIVSWAMSHSSGYGFGFWDFGHTNDWSKYGIFEIIFWSTVGTLLLTIILHAVLLLTNYLRYSRIENFYNFLIVPQEEIDALKKQKNRRDLIIFICSLLVVGLIGFLIYKLVKRNKTTQVVVKN